MGHQQKRKQRVVDCASVNRASQRGVSALTKLLAHYAIYRGEEFITLGTAKECAEFMGWSAPKATQYYASPAYRKKVKPNGNGLVVIKLDGEG